MQGSLHYSSSNLRIQDDKSQPCLKLMQEEDSEQAQTQPMPLHKLVSLYHVSP